MWMIFKKEWRENVLYLAGAFALVLLILDYIAFVYFSWSFLGISSSFLNKFLVVDSIPNYRVDPTLAGPWGVLCIIAAILLGLRQIYAEHLRRTWALLVQLPIGREKIIYAKFLAGLTLLAALFIPAGLLIVLRLRTPGVWPGPVYLSGFLPLLLYLIAGLACYQILLLTALAPLRWFGTRLLIPFAAAPALILVQTMQNHLRVYGGSRAELTIPIWIMSGITLYIIVMGLWALWSVARGREY